MRHDNRTALALITIGLTALFTYSTVYSPASYDPRELEDGHVGEVVRLHGTVHDMNVKGDVTFISLERRPGLDIVSFDRIQGIEQNTTVIIEGTVDLYHGQLEVIADRVATRDG